MRERERERERERKRERETCGRTDQPKAKAAITDALFWVKDFGLTYSKTDGQIVVL